MKRLLSLRVGTMNRRGFFATILGAIAAKLTPKPTTILVPATNEVSFTLVNHAGLSRMDVLYGFRTMAPEMAVRIHTPKPNPANHKYEPNDPRRLPL